MNKLVWLMAAAVLVFSGCSKKETAGAGPVTLEFFSWLDEEPYMTKLINQWNAANPGIQIKGTFVANEELAQKLTVSLSGGSVVDIFCQQTPAGVAEFIALDQVLDLTELLKKNNFDESGISGFMDSFREELGAPYGLPYRKSVWVLFYNKKLFDDAGMPYPKNWTWDQYQEAAQKLTKGSGENKVYGILNYPSTMGWWRIGANITGANNPIIPEHLAAFKKTARRDWDWSYTYNCQPPYAERTGTAGGDYAGSFLQGKFGMMITGDWAVSMLNNGIAAGSELQYDIAEVPYARGDEPYSAGVPTIAAVAKNSKYPEQAFKFISYLAGNEGARFFANEGLIPAWGSPETISIFQERLPTPRNVAVFFTQKVYNQAPFDSKYSQAMRIVNQEMSLYLLKEQDLEKTYDIIAKRIKDEVQ